MAKKKTISNVPKTSVHDDRPWLFKPGNAGGPGRPKGSRNKLDEDMLRDFCAAWEEFGAEAITAVLADSPAEFLRICVALLPKQIQAEVDVRNFIMAPETATDDDWKAFLKQKDLPVLAREEPVKQRATAAGKRTNGSNGTTH